jgi:hypothetical protein
MSIYVDPMIGSLKYLSNYSLGKTRVLENMHEIVIGFREAEDKNGLLRMSWNYLIESMLPLFL